MRKKVLVTGANRGIGLAVAKELGSDCDVVLGGRDAAQLESLCSELRTANPQSHFSAFVADLADAGAVAAASANVEMLDAVVHSAGVLGRGSIAETDREKWRRSFELNVIAVADLTAHLLPALRSRKGRVVMINSGSGFNAGPGGGLYSATKFALRALTDSLREEERSNGVKVISIHPGRVDTDMQHELVADEGKEYDPQRYLKPSSVAQAVKYALSTTDDAVAESLSLRPTGR